MSVLKAKRNESNYEYEHNYAVLYKDISERIAHVPKRRRKWICRELTHTMSVILDDISCVINGYYRTESEIEVKQKYIIDAIENLYILEKNLIAFGNIKGVKDGSLQAWSDAINKEFRLLNGLLKAGRHDKVYALVNYKDMKDVDFIRNMKELHTLVHSKVIRVPEAYCETYCFTAVRCVDNALYEVLMANKFPTTRQEYEARKQHVSNAITYLTSLEKPLVFIFNVMQYSENTLKTLSEAVTGELKMLQALRKSDAERFKDLN